MRPARPHNVARHSWRAKMTRALAPRARMARAAAQLAAHQLASCEHGAHTQQRARLRARDTQTRATLVLAPRSH